MEKTFEEIHAASKLDKIRAARDSAQEASRMLSYLVGQMDDDNMAYYDQDVKSRVASAEGWLQSAIDSIREE